MDSVLTYGGGGGGGDWEKRRGEIKCNLYLIMVAKMLTHTKTCQYSCFPCNVVARAQIISNAIEHMHTSKYMYSALEKR